MKIIAFEITDDQAGAISEMLHRVEDRGTHGALTLQTLAAMLLEDAALAFLRPGSWEGGTMAELLTKHGYPV